jgi:hypothetical protein
MSRQFCRKAGCCARLSCIEGDRINAVIAAGYNFSRLRWPAALLRAWFAALSGSATPSRFA